MTIYYHVKDTFFEDVKTCFQDVDTLLDIGCGIRPCYDINCKTHICLEPWKEYIDIISHCHSNDRNFVFIQNDAINGLKVFADKSVDTICMLDLIEHLEKTDGEILLKEAERIAKKQIIIYTPLGYMSNHTEEKDAWGLNGAHFQEHLSGWEPQDFDDSWDLHICEKFILKDQHHIPLDKDYGAIWAIKTMTYFEQPKPKTPDFVKNETAHRNTKVSEFDILNNGLNSIQSKQIENIEQILSLNAQKFAELESKIKSLSDIAEQITTDIQNKIDEATIVDPQKALTCFYKMIVLMFVGIIPIKNLRKKLKNRILNKRG